MFMLKNSKGQKDSMYSFAVIGLWVTVFSILAPMLKELSIGEFSFTIASPDATIVSAFLGATLISYVTRRNSKDKFAHEEKMKRIEKGILE